MKIYEVAIGGVKTKVDANNYRGLLKAIRQRFPSLWKANPYIVWHEGDAHFLSDTLQREGDVCTNAGIVGRIKEGAKRNAEAQNVEQ